MSDRWDRRTRLLYSSPLHNAGLPFLVRYHRKVRNDDSLVEVLFPFEVDGGGFHRIPRHELRAVELIR